MKRLSKSLLIGAAALSVLTGAFAQSRFWTGIGTTSDWNSAIWGDGNRGTVELILAPGSDFYLFFKVQFQPGLVVQPTGRLSTCFSTSRVRIPTRLSVRATPALSLAMPTRLSGQRTRAATLLGQVVDTLSKLSAGFRRFAPTARARAAPRLPL
jgi:hypothetical protein